MARSKTDASLTAAEADARRVALLDWAETRDVGALWSTDDARWATQQARAEGGTDFRIARARHAARRLGERDERLAQLVERRRWSTGWVMGAALAGLVLGVAADRLGGQLLNLLALPLWPLLGLQLLAYAVLLAFALRSRRATRAPDLLLWLGRRLLTPGQRGRGRAAQVQAHWWRLSLPLQSARTVLLWHAGVLGLNLGLIAGLYLRALGMEVLIGWESTYLDAAQVQRLADLVLAPAAAMTGITVPDVAPLRHAALQGPTASAADWLHLLAATVGLVTLPRLLLLVSAATRSWRLARALPLPAGSAPGDLRLLLIGSLGRLAGSLLGEAGERLASPEGDRLLLTRADATPSLPVSRWPVRVWSGLAPAPALDTGFDASVAAEELPPGAPGWPAQRRQLLALGQLWPQSRQPVWQRLLNAWERPMLEREEKARELLADTLAGLCLQPVQLPEGAQPQAQLQLAVQQQLEVLAARLETLYGAPPASMIMPDAAQRWAHQVVRPYPVARNSVLGGALGGAATGLGADLAAGGLTLGAGALAGAVLGGVAGSGLTGWLNRREGRQTSTLQMAPTAAPALLAEVLGVWLAQLGVQLPAAQVAARAAALDWSTTLHGDVAAARRELAARIDEACAALLRDADTAS
ncbi:DUF3482 domain-containing protein [Roseateles sp.]|uniref:DUF3482 domain-containing protein n=1 Tax=Roseateles sp. TaxID=1971397 RepID=UPI0039EC217D